MASIGLGELRLPIAFRDLFAYRVEERLSLRILVLALGWWVAFSLGWTGAPVWVWVGGGMLLSVGHALSWRSRHTRSLVRSALVGMAVLGSLVLMPRAVTLATGGNWMPIAHFLLYFQGMTAFQLRSRGGLYVSIAMSGVIFFFASQSALDASFAVFPIGFAVLLLSFLGVSYLLDQARHADVRWFKSPFTLAGSWSAVFAVLLVVSGALFVFLPELADPLRRSSGVLLPMRAEVDDVIRGVPEFDVVASALPLTGFGDSDHTQVSSATGEGDVISPGNTSLIDGTPDTPPSASTAGERRGSALAPMETSAVRASGQGCPYLGNLNADDELVMRVRSPVLTYWRGRVYDTFDGAQWHGRFSDLRSQFRQRDTMVYRYHEPPNSSKQPLYSQIYFTKLRSVCDPVFTGYAPLLASVPVADSDGDGDPADSTYRVISVLPDLSEEILDDAGPSSRLHSSYLQIPESLAALREAAELITADSYTDLERMRRIVAYLERNYYLRVGTADRLALTLPPIEFLSQRSSGTVMDFGTASVLLARAAGVPARLATGFLPGRRDPLSGTFVVQYGHRHAWAEAYLGGVGWVPFDAAPLPERLSFGASGSFRSPTMNALFTSSYGYDLYQTVRTSPGWLADLAVRSLSTPSGATALIVFAMAASAFVAWRAGWWRQSSIAQSPRYTALAGDDRARMLGMYDDAEGVLQKGLGLAPRARSQTRVEHTAEAEDELGDCGFDLRWLRDAAHEAAYRTAPFDQGRLAEAGDHLRGLKAGLKERHKRQWR